MKNFIFSSSATVYGKQDIMPIKENAILGIQTNPYGKTKRMIEEILEDLYKSDNSFNITILRYFNPIGAHKSGLIGEIPNGVPNNLVPYITQVLSGKLPFLKIYGNDYNTPDGTGIRDFIHVVDLAHAHILALSSPKGFNIFNVGTGKGYSVLDVVNCFEKVTNKTINKIICDRRQGDVDICYADISKIKSTLGFTPSKSLEDCCLDQWLFELNKDK